MLGIMRLKKPGGNYGLKSTGTYSWLVHVKKLNR